MAARQTSFGAGELNPLLWGRTDLAAYGKGTRTMRNFFPSKAGAAVSRPGTEYVATAKAVDFAAEGLTNRDRPFQQRLIPFFAGDDVAYVLEFGHRYIRFYSRGEQVLAGGVPYEVATPYSVDELWDIKYAQTGDVLTLVSPTYDARELQIFGPSNWTLTTISFEPFQPYFYDPGNPANPTSNFCIVDNGTGVFPSAQASTSDRPAREWQWQVTAVVKDKTTGAVYETMGELVSGTFFGGAPGSLTDIDHTFSLLSSDSWCLYADRPILLERQETAALLPKPDGADTYDVIAFNIYRGRGGLFGFVGQTKGRTFVDVGEQPDYAIQPPLGTQPFGTDTQTIGAETRHLDRPWTVGFFQERRVFAGSTLKPETVHASVTGDYNNFDTRLAVHVSGEALEFTLAARKREEIRALLTRQRLLVFTGSSVWSVGGSQGSPIDFDDIDARLEDEAGATHLQPVVVDGNVLYARAKGIGVRALVADDQFSRYKGVDVSEVAQHLFLGQGKQLVDWCHAQDPWAITWAVRGDGVLLSFTFNGESWGWARHDTDGLYQSVCSVPEDDEDAVYVLVLRTVNGVEKRYVERMTSRVKRYPLTLGLDEDGDPIPAPAPLATVLWPDDLCIDCALQYVGPPVTTFDGLDALEGKNVWVLARGQDPVGPLLVQGGELVDGQGNVADVYGDPPDPNAVDGAGTPVFCAFVGLLFTPQLQTLDIAGGGERVRKKVVSRIGFEVDQSIGLQVGPTFDENDLEEWIERDVDDDGFNAISAATELVDSPVKGDWDESARACLQQSAPRPVTVVGLSRVLVQAEEE